MASNPAAAAEMARSMAEALAATGKFFKLDSIENSN